MTLTIQQRAQRRTKKINNRVARSLPLFAGTPAISQFLTDVQTQVKRVQIWDEINEHYFSKLDLADQDFADKAKAYRSMVADLQPDQLQIFDAELDYLINRWMAYQQPVYIADFWHEKLRAMDAI